MVSFFMLAPTLLQWVLKKLLIHHLGEHPLGMFVDLCYVANVSIFMFDDEYRRARYVVRFVFESIDRCVLDQIRVCTRFYRLSTRSCF